MFYNDDGEAWIPKIIDEEMARSLFDKKDIFCNFIYGHPSANGMRELLFKRLNEYKPVLSPGSYLNNVNANKRRCSWQEKYEYLIRSKFTIACDSIAYPGFITEKIMQPFTFHSVPVYNGNPNVCDDFNEKSFVWCKSKNDVERVVEQIIYLDTHDDEYMKMLMECPLVGKNHVENIYFRLEQFLANICSQDPDEARRRIRHFYADIHEKECALGVKAYYSNVPIKEKIYKALKGCKYGDYGN